MPTPFRYGEDRLTPAIALALAEGRRRGELTNTGRARVTAAAAQVAALAAGDAVCYGINTGFGPLCATVIPPGERAVLQEKLLMSHAVGVGAPVEPIVARLMLVQKVHALSLGHSGVSVPVLERLLWLLEAGYTPVVPRQGSVGASGDLAPLAHLFLPLIGLGYLDAAFAKTRPDDAAPVLRERDPADDRATSTKPGAPLNDADSGTDTGTDAGPAATNPYERAEAPGRGALVASAELLRRHGLEPLRLAPKDGLALINGTQFIAAYAVLCCLRLERCLEQAALNGAMMVDGLQGSISPFDERLHALRPHRGAVHVAATLRGLLAGSEIPAAHADCDRVQDPYSLRCMPQVHGASYDAWAHLRDALEVELNAVTDNPVLVGGGDIVSGGSFHGQPLALPLDYATLAAAELGSIAERRVYLSLLGTHPNVPTLLLRGAGLDSGFMIVQYTAAALASENKTLCFPASADTIPTGMGQEDHVSMGSIGGRKCLRVIGNLERIQAIELLCAAQALDFQRPLRSGAAVEALHARVRAVVPHATEDRVFGEDIAAITEVLKH